jgi:hypothetical protein
MIGSKPIPTFFDVRPPGEIVTDYSFCLLRV